MVLGQIKKKIEHDRVYYKLKLSVSWLGFICSLKFLAYRNSGN